MPIITHASGGTGDGSISSVLQRECTGEHRGFEVRLELGHFNPDGCKVSTVLSISCDHKAFNQLVSLSLTAMLADKKISAWVNGCNSDGKAIVKALSIHK